MGESTGGGGNESDNEPQGTIFGVDGVSKTGSTSKDQQIGFTDGQGGRGANFDALQGATSQQTTAAVAAADAARNAGGGGTAAQQAVRGILDSYDPSAVNRQGNLTDSGRNLVNEAAQDALEFERITQDQQRAQFASDLIGGFTTDLGAGAAPQVAPPNFDSQLLDFLNAQDAQAAEDFRAAEVAGVRAPPVMGPEMQLMTLPSPNPRDAIAEALRTSPYSGTNNTLLTNKMLSARTSQEERQSILQELRNRATLGDEGARQDLADVEAREELGLAGAGRVDMTAPNPFAAPARQALVPVGIQSLPEAATAAAVLRGPDDVIQEQRAAQAVAQPPIGGSGTTTPASQSAIVDPRADVLSVTPMEQFALDQEARARGTDPLLQTGTAPMPTGDPMQRVDPTQVGGISVPTPPPDRFKTNAQRDFFENLSSLPGGQAQFDAELANLANRGFTGRRIASVIGEGGVPNYDPSAPEGFRIRGATGTNFVDLPFLGTTPISTYTGLDNPNAPADTSSDEPVTAKAPNDPCPAGYQLVNGVCQPVDDLTQPPDPPGSDFQINPTTGLPTVFQPTTVATPVGPINPFVLQPSPPVGINPPAQGIQALSPTGAALGRQV
tara:strand:+ start:26454 stop:28286 length:1833 start_codon:yes stop_codon:yes gene_type:complete